jgi:GNAT superfamily N-acetyltransferase
MPFDAARYRIRRAIGADAAIVAHHRVAMFRDMGILPEADVERLATASRRYLDDALASGDYLGWLIEADGAVVAGAGALVRPLLPRPGYVEGGVDAYVLNVYTEPGHRRCGLARALMETVLDHCRAAGMARVTLHASDEGRPLYTALGFTATSEMERRVQREQARR